jgi:uncharacterized protein YdhG (YjbR/CyaY superfamily)
VDGFDATTAGWPDDARGALDRVAALARTVVPDAVEGVSYGLPALLVDGRALIGVSHGAHHLAVVPFSPSAIDAVRHALTGFTTSRGVIRFVPDQPLPDDVILRLVHLRLAEIRP